MKNCYCEVTDFPVANGLSIGKIVYDNLDERVICCSELTGEQLSDATYKALVEAAEKHHRSLNRRQRVQRKYRRDRTTPLNCEVCKHKMSCIAMPGIERTFEARE